MLHRLLLLFLICLWANPCLASPSDSKVTTLEQARSRVIEHNPSIRSYSHRIRAASASASQAALLPNPELELEVEEFGGDLDGFRESEASIAITQPIELGGKREARTAVAQAKQEQAELEAKIVYLEAISTTEVAFARVLATQSLVDILKKQAEVSKKVVKNVKKRLDAGAILPVEETKAQINLKNDSVALEIAQSELLIAKQELAILWKGSSNEVGIVQGNPNLKNIDAYLKTYDIGQSPYQKLNKAQNQIAKEKIKLEKSLAIPDLNVGFGYKRFEASNEDSFLGLVSIDIPIFNRNQGAINSAREQEQVELLLSENNLALLTSKFSAYQIKLRRLLHEYRSLADSILPSAEKAFKQANDAYNRGRTSYLELLDAQRTLVDSQKRKAELIFEITEAKSFIDKFRGTNTPKNMEEN